MKFIQDLLNSDVSLSTTVTPRTEENEVKEIESYQDLSEEKNG